jgi:hypothetical protein
VDAEAASPLASAVGEAVDGGRCFIHAHSREVSSNKRVQQGTLSRPHLTHHGEGEPGFREFEQLLDEWGKVPSLVVAGEEFWRFFFELLNQPDEFFIVENHVGRSFAGGRALGQ